MPDSEASGDSRLDTPVDTDRLDVGAPGAEPVDDQFEYLFDEAPDPDPSLEWVDAERDPEALTDHFDAFNANTWHFKPAPTPWYRTSQAVIGIALVALAMIALVVAVVLLTVRGQSDEQAPSHTSPTTATTDAPPGAATGASSATATSPLPPPPPAPPPPPPPPPPATSAPAYYPPRYENRPTKKPEINVTRSPMSVAPQPRGPR